MFSLDLFLWTESPGFVKVSNPMNIILKWLLRLRLMLKWLLIYKETSGAVSKPLVLCATENH